MTEYYGTGVEDIFNTMEERFLPQGAQGVDCSIGYNITGEGGGKWTLSVKNGKMGVEKIKGKFEGCAVILNAEAEAFVGLTLGKIDAADAFSSGKVKIDGDMAIIGNVLPKIFKPFTPIVKAKGIIESMPERFLSQKADGVDIKVGYEILGKDGGKWTVVVENNTCKVKSELDDDCTVVMRMDAQVFVDLNTGKIDGAEAFGSGKVTIDGDMGAAGTVAKLFTKFESQGEIKERGEEFIVKKCIPSINQRYATGPIMGKWFKGLKKKIFYGTKCPKCGRVQVLPREICAECRVRSEDFVEVGPNATVSYIDIVYYASPDPLTGKVRETPYAGLFMVLDGSSPEESFSHELNPKDIDRIKPGMKIRPVWAKERTGSYTDLMYFEIDD